MGIIFGLEKSFSEATCFTEGPEGEEVGFRCSPLPGHLAGWSHLKACFEKEAWWQALGRPESLGWWRSSKRGFWVEDHWEILAKTIHET